MKLFLKVFLGLIISGFYLGTANAMIEIPSYDDSTKTIIVDQTKPQFEIVQAANPTTGYSWKVTGYDKKLLKLMGSHYIPSKSQLAGAGGKMRWDFKAMREAFKQETTETTIHLTYARSWAPNDHPTSVEFKIMFIKKVVDDIE